MSYYYSLRGWLEIDSKYSALLMSKIQWLRSLHAPDSAEAAYMEGWCGPCGGGIDSHYLFYGAYVQERGLDLFKQVLDELARMRYGMSGYFHAEGEDGGRNYEYRVADDTWRVNEARLRVQPIPAHEGILLGQVYSQQDATATILRLLTGEQMVEPGVQGPWSIKDVLAHLTEWEQRVSGWILVELQGETIGPDQIPPLAARDTLNDAAYYVNRDRPLADVLAYYKAANLELIQMIARLPDASLYWHITENIVEHFQEHRAAIEAWVQRTYPALWPPARPKE
jgi:DinB superfamily